MNYVENFNFYGVDAKEIPCIKGEGLPTTSTEGAVGCFYMDTSTGEIYKCTNVENGTFTWDFAVTNGYVTPEMFGCVGDGITDDTNNFQACVNSGYPIYARNKYRISSQIRSRQSLILFGEGTFMADSADKRYVPFYIAPTGNEKIPLVEVRGLSFVTVRDNVNVFAPEGHTRPDGGLTSNVNFFVIDTVKKVIFDNVEFSNGETDIQTTHCTNVHISNFNSIDTAFHIISTYCENVLIENGSISLYEILGDGDHHIYIDKGNGDVCIKNVKMYSQTRIGAIYPVHCYSNIEGGYGADNLTVSNCYIEHSRAICGYVKNGINIENTTFVNISDMAYDTFLAQPQAEAPETIKNKITGCVFKNTNGYLNQFQLKNETIFSDCKFEANGSVYLSNTANIAFNRCDFECRISINVETTHTFTDCTFNFFSGYCVTVMKNISTLCDFYNCRFKANADGIFNVGGASTFTLVGCSGTNEKSTKKFNYDSGNTLVTYKLYHCTFPELTFRNEGQTLVEKYNVWAE